eukprot:gene17423-19167_t
MGSASSKFKKAIKQGNEALAYQLYLQNPCIPNKLDVNAAYDNDDSGNTPLHFVAKYCMKSLMKDFISRGGNPNIKNLHGQTTLHMLMIPSCDSVLVAAQKRLDCLHMLLRWTGQISSDGNEETLNIHATDKENKTALHYAAASGLLLCIQCLVGENVPLFWKDKNELTACNIAEQNHHFAVAAFLEAKMIFSFQQKEEIIHASVQGNSIFSCADFEYTSLNPVNLQEAKDQLIIDISDMLQLPLFTAEALLHKHSWSKEKLLESWMTADPKTICENSGVQLPQGRYIALEINKIIWYFYGSKVFANQLKIILSLDHTMKTMKITSDNNVSEKQTEENCDICEDYFSTDESIQMTEMSCGHKFCNKCWDRYLSAKISHGQTHNIFCPGHACEKLVPVEFTEKLVSRDMAKIYLEFDIKAFVDTNPYLRWCPHPNCDMAIKLPEQMLPLNSLRNGLNAKSVDCGKGHYFCCECFGEAHEPCSCDQWQKWKEKVKEIDPQKESGLTNKRSAVATAYWLVTNSKKCPSCKSHIEKNQGCNHMTCSKCKHEFCWVCMEPWKIHSAETGGYFRCNRFEVVKKVEQRHERDQQELELRLLDAVNDKMICLRKTLYELAIYEEEKKDKYDLQFLESAVKELLKSRQILKGSYPYRYFLDISSEKVIVFEFMQNEVEQATESLSHMIAQRFLKSTRVQIINGTNTLSRKRKEFLAAVGRGVIPDDNLDDNLGDYRDVEDDDYSRFIPLSASEEQLVAEEELAMAIASNRSLLQTDSGQEERRTMSEEVTKSRESVSDVDAAWMNDETEPTDDGRQLSNAKVIAECSYTADLEDEMSIEAGDVIDIIEKRSDGWYKGRCNGRQGFFPSTFVIELQSNSCDHIDSNEDHEQAGPERERRDQVGRRVLIVDHSSIMEIEVLVAKRHHCAEGPHWDHENKRLLFIDIFGKTCTTVDLDSKKANEISGMTETVSAVVPRAGYKNQVVICHGNKLEFLDLESGKLELIAQVDKNADNRLNDAKCDPEGRLWAGTMGPEASPGKVTPEQGSVFCLDEKQNITQKFDKVNIANGLAWSLDRSTFYYIDSLLRGVDAFDYDVQTGEIKDRRTAIDIKSFEPFKYIPDGMCIDAEGMLWVCLFNGGKVIRCDPNTGKKISEIKMPVTQTTSCCFAGENLDQLIITSASLLSKEELDKQPSAGFIFRVKNIGVHGVKSTSYVG